MAIKGFKPVTPGRRHMTVSTFEEITKTSPEKSLLVSLPKNAGRNSRGMITMRHRGGGAKKKYRIIDLKAIGMYVLLAAVLYVAAEYVPIDNIYLRMAYRTVLLILFIAYVVKRDLPLNQIPILNKLLKH